MYPAPSQQRRAPAALQPYYYHSSVFIDPTREDISRMLSSFEDSCTAQTISRPFALFKSIWAQHGWDLIHLKVLDGRGREAFLDVMCRLFLECILQGRTPLLSLGGLFALYIFYTTQPRSSSELFILEHVPIASDDYQRIVSFPHSLEAPPRNYATKVVMELLSKQVFLILPQSSLKPLKPSTLPASMLAIDSAAPSPAKKKKPGRPSRRDKITRADATLHSLEEALNRLDTEANPVGVTPSTRQYVQMKDIVVASVNVDDVDRAEKKTIDRMRKLETKLKSDGAERLLLLKAEAASMQRTGLLKLVHEPDDAAFE